MRELCERTCLSLATVYRKIGRIRNGESLEKRKGRGRPQKFSAFQEKAITQIALKNPLFSAADVKNCFEKSHKHSVSSRTYHRTLLRSGISKKMPKKEPNISQQQEIKRLDFCKQFNVPGIFDNVSLTDESSFQLHRNTIKVWSSKNSSPKKLWSGVLCRKKDFSCISTKIMRMLTPICTRTPLPTSYLMSTSFIQTVGFLNRTARPHIQQPALEITCQGMAFKFCSRHRIHPIFGLLRMFGRYSSMRLSRKIRKILTNLDNMLGIVAQFWI